MSDLFEPYKITEKVLLRNRLVMAPMTTWSSQADGQISLEELDYYRVRSTGVGMVVTGTTYGMPGGRGFENQFYGGDDLYIKSLGRLAQAIHMGGAKAVLQIFHVGRMTSAKVLGGNQAVAPSAVAAERPDAEVPRALEEEEIYNIIDSFYEMTRRAIAAGFDGVEIHGANTYLIQQFFSPHANRRDDYWGGDLERRMRFPIGVISSVKRAVKDHGSPGFMIGYRLSPEELETPGIRLKDTLRFVDILVGQNLSYLNLSMGHYDQRSIVDPSSKEEVGRQILDVIKGRLPVLGVGGINNFDDAVAARNYGYDGIQLGKTIIMNPDWVERVTKKEAVRTALRTSEANALYIPKGLMAKIKANDGWFNLIDDGEPKLD